ncbi:copper resistance CopC family protein [Cellulomonas alba]|uniref:Copper resistance protein CopC n=1 Tax=Cellulomonas alba TaxID=3053467 RepID=A0ABT7SFC9_9CELL|nr:copper resistance CopC family protein [Cellulomonas alba]MDM7854903.1 copper resistance protein CopC [Cellulomonas alba]
MTLRTAARRLGALVAVLLTTGGVLVAGAASAQAHDELVGTDPADGSTVAVAPDHVTLTFGEPAQELGTEIVVTAADGTRVSVGRPSLADDTVTQALADSRPDGRYTVKWRVTSADGHPVSGTFTFTAVGAAAVVPDTATARPTAATALPTATSTPTADPKAWGDGDNHVRPALIGFLLLVVAVGVGLATWLVSRRNEQ